MSKLAQSVAKGVKDTTEKKTPEVKPSAPKEEKIVVGKTREIFKVRSKGDLGVPTRVAQEAGITAGMKFTCKTTAIKGQVLIEKVQ